MSEHSHSTVAEALTIRPVPRFWLILRIFAAGCLGITALFAIDTLGYWSPPTPVSFFLQVFGPAGAGAALVSLLWVEVEKREYPPGDQEVSSAKTNRSRHLKAVLVMLFVVLGVSVGLWWPPWLAVVSPSHLMVFIGVVGGMMFGCYFWLQVEESRDPSGR